MKYMLLIYSAESAWTQAEWETCVSDSVALCQRLKARGELMAAAPLHPVATATSVRLRDDKTLVSDGPFAETHEQMGGFYLIDVPDLDAAIAVADQIPAALRGTVEIRPIVELVDLPLPGLV